MEKIIFNFEEIFLIDPALFILVANHGGQGGFAGPIRQEGVAGPSGRNQEAHSEPIEIKAEDVKQEPRMSHSRVVVTAASNAGKVLLVAVQLLYNMMSNRPSLIDYDNIIQHCF